MANDTLKPGRVSSFSNSMAEAIDEAFKEEWQIEIGTPLLEAGTRERKVLFAAIARGVVKHFEQHPGAFEIDVSVKQTDEILMKSDNLANIPTSGIGVISTGDADVSQIDQENNRIESAGMNKVNRIHVDD